MAHWLTPDTPPEDKFYFRTLRIPAASDFLGLVNGALIELALTHNYEVSGDMSAQDTADMFLTEMLTFWHNQNEPPDWEAPDDLDGEPEQPWYEDLADWIIAGFLAITFTPQAAIVYQSTVPRLRIAIRTGDLGALFRVLINGVEVWTGDSYGVNVDLIEQTFDMSAETEPYTVRIEHNGIGEGHGLSRAKLEVVRGKALAEMVATILRADPTGCGIQWSQDNGDTWETVDLADCITTLAEEAIAQAIEDGIIAQQGTQQGPQPALSPGQCQTFHVVLSANGQWICPVPVSEDDTINVANATGGWTDGTPAWYCPDGNSYGLGHCGTND